uniref:Uncharacterized protein n=1 Tax=Romanomermis culicivorax TaxID=13658 RepID=A0A915KH93_ROMCU
MAAILKISFEQLKSHEAINIFDNCGSKGNSAITEPNCVNSPSSSKAAKYVKKKKKERKESTTQEIKNKITRMGEENSREMTLEWIFSKQKVMPFALRGLKMRSITKTTPSIVSDVSAILVETTHLRPIAPLDFLAGAGSKMRCCKLGGKVEYSGMHRRSPISEPKLSISFLIRLQASSISCGK